MYKERFTARAFRIYLLLVIMIGVCFMVLSCNKNDKQAVTTPVSSSESSADSQSTAVSSSSTESRNESLVTSSSDSKTISRTLPSSSAVTDKDLTSKKYKKKFMNYIYNYYNEIVGRISLGHHDIKPPLIRCTDYAGNLTSSNAEAVIRCAIDQNFPFGSLDKYTFKNPDESSYLEFPKDIGDQAIKSSFNVSTIDHSLFKCYDVKKQKYVIDGEDFGGDGELFAAPDIKSIKQREDKIIIEADFYEFVVRENGAMPQTEYGTDTPNYNKKYQSMRYTFKISNGNYLYEKIETIQ